MNSTLVLRIMVVEGMMMVPKCFRIYPTADSTTLSSLSPHSLLLAPTMWYFSW